MFNTEHWTICRQFSKNSKFQEKINSFMVFGETGESLLIVTEDGKGYFYKEGYDEPILWNSVSNIVDAAQGKTHTLVLNQEGMVYLYGGCFLRTDDELKKNCKLTDPLLISTPHRFISVKCGIEHCLALTKDGKVFAWGRNESYQVGHCDDSNALVYEPYFIFELDYLRIVAIACGGFHSLALTDDGDVYCWGNNSGGQIGILDNIDDGQFDGRVRLNSKYYSPLRMETPCAIKAIAAGRVHTLLLTHDGQVYASGLCLSGFRRWKSSNLKIVDGLPSICQIGSHFSDDFSIAISFDRTCFVWNLDFLLVPLRLPMWYSTIDSALSLFSSFACIPNLVRVQETKLSSCLARMFDNSETSDIQFVVQDKIIHAHRFILRNASRHFDQMFSNSKTLRCSENPMKVKIVIADHSYLVFHAYLRFLYTDCLPDNCFENITELLKLAISYQEVTLQQKCYARLQCNNPGMAQFECGNSTSYWPIMQELSPDFLKNVLTFMVMRMGEVSVLMTTNTGDVYRFGTIWNRICDDTPTKLNVSNIIQMAHGYSHILMLNQQGQIFAFGLNNCGQLGWKRNPNIYNYILPLNKFYFEPRLISSPYRFVSIKCGKDHSLALTEDGVVFGWGANQHCQVATERCRSHSTLNRISELSSLRVVQIACGYNHSLALIEDGTVFSWGDNRTYQLGHSVRDEEYCCRVPTRIEISFPIKSISAGRCHSFLLTQSGQLYWCCDFPTRHILAVSNDVLDRRLAETNYSRRLQKVHHLPPISQIVGYFYANESFAVTFNKSCFVLDLFERNPQTFICPTIDFAFSFNSPHRCTPYSFQFEGSKTDFLLNYMTRMFDNPEASDVQFVVEKNRTIHAHRAILQDSSRYFERMFSKTWYSQIDNLDNPISKILIPDHSYSVFCAYIHFLYTGRLQISSNDLTELFELAIFYLEDHLQQLCLDRMWCDLSVENCCHYYQLTERYDKLFPRSFVRNLIQFISFRTRLVYSSEAYRTLDQTQQQKLSFLISKILCKL